MPDITKPNSLTDDQEKELKEKLDALHQTMANIGIDEVGATKTRGNGTIDVKATRGTKNP